MPKQKVLRLRRSQAGLLVVDVQERLVPAMFERERLIQNVVRLIRSAAILNVPVFATEQYRKGLGSTVPEVAAALGEDLPIEKVSFSACGAAGLTDALQAKGVSDVIVCGIETHVCVCQTCLDLLGEDYRIFVVADAVSSRAFENCRIGLARMRHAGAVIVSTEMVLFELLAKAGSDEFKRILALVK